MSEELASRDEDDRRDYKRRKSLVALLEFEITQLTVRERQPGWTRWALLAALGSLVWLGAGEIQTAEHLDPETVAYLFLVLSLGTRVAEELVSFLNFGSDDDNAPSDRLRPAGMRLPVSRAASAVVIAKSALLVWIAWLNSKIPATGVGTAAIWFWGFSTALYVWALALTFTPAMMGVNPRSRRTNLITFGLAVVLPVYCLLGPVDSLLEGRIVTHLPEWKLAFLSLATFEVLGYLVVGVREAPLRGTLVDLRRKLGTGDISFESAKRQIDAALYGLGAGDVIQQDVDDALTIFRQATSYARTGAVEAENLANKVDQGKLSPEEETKLPTAKLSLSALRKAAPDELEKGKTKASALRRRARWILGPQKKGIALTLELLNAVERESSIEVAAGAARIGAALKKIDELTLKGNEKPGP